MAYEGGGIRRGLNPIQVAVLLKQPDREVLQLGILEALTAGKIKLLPGEEIKFALADHLAVEELNPRDRREGRQRAGLEAFQVISAVDDVLLELIRQHQGQAIGSLQPDIWLAQLSDNTDLAISGFDREQTVEYYDAFMSHRLMGVSGGHFKAEEYLGWLVLAGQAGVLSKAAVDVVAEQINPDWLPDGISLGAWLEKLKAAL